jgi:hypothetical protein
MGHRYLRPVYTPPAPQTIIPLEFPEYRYAPQVNKEEYKDRINLGAKRTRKAKLGIVGCARDIAHTFERTQYYITTIGSLFADYELFIYESDSKDNTASLLQNWKRNNYRVNYISECLAFPRLVDLSPKRFEVMATIRNKYVKYAQENMNDCDYFCVIDMDLRIGVSTDGILNSFGYAELWDAIFSNGLDRDEKYQYDVAVLTYNGFEESDVMVEQKANMAYANFKPGFTRPSYERGSPLVPVKSAFGGMGFYMADAFLSGRYASYPLDHIGFNKTIHEAGFTRKYINPSQILIR